MMSRDGFPLTLMDIPHHRDALQSLLPVASALTIALTLNGQSHTFKLRSNNVFTLLLTNMDILDERIQYGYCTELYVYYKVKDDVIDCHVAVSRGVEPVQTGSDPSGSGSTKS